LQLLPLAHRIKGGARIIFDAREYYPKQNEDSILFRILERPERIRLCKEYLHWCDALVTVSDGLAEEYEREFGVRMHVVRSVPNYVDLSVSYCDATKIKMVHHGRANQNRQLENMIMIMEELDERFSLDLYLTGNREYINKLKKRTKEHSRIRLLDPVPFSTIIPMLSHYDIGFCFFTPTTFNLRHCLPNKLFEFIQARLMVAIGPSPDMASLVKEYDCGVISPSFEIKDMTKYLNRLTPDLIQKLKQNSDAAARELCFEVEGKKLEKIITDLVGSRTISSSVAAHK
jgi:glycosyltransferase involved in cell wall biosynthesis